MNNTNLMGILITLSGAIFWGVSGACAQYLQVDQHMNTEWLIPFRLFSAGIITVIYAYFRSGNDIFRVFSNKRDIFELIIFGVLGIALCQYSYFVAIVYAGAGIATVLQYVAPIIIILYLFIVHGKRPSNAERISVVLASLGTLIIALHGELSLAGFNAKVMFWGLTSAAAVAIYTVQPVGLIYKYGTLPISGWGLIAGGIASLSVWEPLAPNVIMNFTTIANLFGVSVIGTVLAFNLYLEGVRRVGSIQGSIIASTEPLSAAIISWLFLGNIYTTSDVLGFSLIISTIFILALGKKAKKK